MIISKNKKKSLILVRNQNKHVGVSKSMCLQLVCLNPSVKKTPMDFERLWYHQVSKANRCATDASLDRLTSFWLSWGSWKLRSYRLGVYIYIYFFFVTMYLLIYGYNRVLHCQYLAVPNIFGVDPTVTIFGKSSLRHPNRRIPMRPKHRWEYGSLRGENARDLTNR